MNRCLCFPLATGGLIIGIFQIMWALLDFVFICVHFHLADSLKSNEDSSEVKENIYEFKTQILTELFDGSYSSSPLLLIRDLIWSTTDLIFASILLHGVSQKCASLLRIWMVYQATSIVLNICLEIHEYATTTRVDPIMIAVFFVFSPLLSVYALLVVDELRDSIIRPKTPYYDAKTLEKGDNSGSFSQLRRETV